MRFVIVTSLACLIPCTAGMAQTSTWTPTNDARIQYRWQLDQKISDNWRCVISYRWVGGEIEGKAYTVKGKVTYERDKHGGGGQLTRSLFALFTKQQREAEDPVTGCGRVVALRIDSVQ